MKYFVIGSDELIYDLYDCGDIEAAIESAEDLLLPDVAPSYIFDADTAQDYADFINRALSEYRPLSHRQF